jgi:hypothetical protein
MASTSQLARLISTTATMVVSCSNGIQDLLRSFNCGMGPSVAANGRSPAQQTNQQGGNLEPIVRVDECRESMLLIGTR